MSEVHRIRLRGPWEVDGNRHVRKFGKPRLSDPNERVWLVIEGGSEGECRLNDQLLGAIEEKGTRFDVTNLLLDRNRLEMTSISDFPFEVQLEISVQGG